MRRLRVLEPRVVVGAAILRKDLVLAARRRSGGWEFPGGKVEPGETEQQALIRECHEELGVRIECLEALPGQWPINDALTLRVYLARVLEGEPTAGADHDALRWLVRDELADLEWLPADLSAVRLLDGLARRHGDPQRDMLICMRTTINLPDALAEAAKGRAAEQGRTFTSLVEEGLRAVLSEQVAAAPPAKLPVSGVVGGRALVDILDKDALGEILDADGFK